MTTGDSRTTFPALDNVQNNLQQATPLLPSSVQQQGIVVKTASPSILVVYGFFSPNDEYDANHDCQGSHHERGAGEAKEMKDPMQDRRVMPVHQRRERQIESRQWVVMDHVLSHVGEDRENEETRGETDDEMN